MNENAPSELLFMRLAGLVNSPVHPQRAEVFGVGQAVSLTAAFRPLFARPDLLSAPVHWSGHERRSCAFVRSEARRSLLRAAFARRAPCIPNRDRFLPWPRPGELAARPCV